MKDDQPSTTAEAVAFWRALEQRYPEGERILNDPYAREMLTRPGRLWVDNLLSPAPISLADASAGAGTLIYTLLRHRWMEDAFLRAGQGWEQVLILGAGYDMRALRLDFGDARVIEIDHPATGKRKARQLKRLGLPLRAEQVAVDFAKENLEDALKRIGFQKGKKTWFFWEGVAMYLPENVIQYTLRILHDYQAEGVFDLYAPPPSGGGLRGMYHRAMPRVVQWIGEPVRSEVPIAQAAAFVYPAGYQVMEVAWGDTLAVLSKRKTYPNPLGWALRVKPVELSIRL